MPFTVGVRAMVETDETVLLPLRSIWIGECIQEQLRLYD